MLAMKISSTKFLNLVTMKLKQQIESRTLTSLADYVEYIQNFKQQYGVHVMECLLTMNDDDELIELVLVDLESKRERQISLKAPYERFGDPIATSFHDLAELLRREVEQHRCAGMKIYLDHVLKYNQTTAAKAELKIDHILAQLDRLVLKDLATELAIAYELKTGKCEVINPNSVDIKREDSGLGDEIGSGVKSIGTKDDDQEIEDKRTEIADQSKDKIAIENGGAIKQAVSKRPNFLPLVKEGEQLKQESKRTEIADQSKDEIAIENGGAIKQAVSKRPNFLPLVKEGEQLKQESKTNKSNEAKSTSDSLKVDSPKKTGQQLDSPKVTGLKDDVIEVIQAKKKLSWRTKVAKFLLKYMLCVRPEELND